MRYHIIGLAGSGKTTVARQLATSHNAPHIKLDGLHWGANWQRTPRCQFREAIKQFVCGENWVADGDYKLVSPLIWKQVDTIVWLDSPAPMTLWRLMNRNIPYAIQGKELWNSGCRETLRNLVSGDSILLSMLKKYSDARAKYEMLMQHPGFRHIDFVHLRSPSETQIWLNLASFVLQRRFSVIASHTTY